MSCMYLYVGMVMEIHGTYKLIYHPVEGDSEKVFEVDFTPPFRRVSMIPELEKQLNVTFPPATDFHTPGGLLCTYFYSLFLEFLGKNIFSPLYMYVYMCLNFRGTCPHLKVCFTCQTETFFVRHCFAEFHKFLDDLCVKHNVECGHPRTSARLLDKVLLYISDNKQQFCFILIE